MLSILIITLSFLPFLVFHQTRKYFNFALLALLAIILHGVCLFGFQILFFFIVTYIISTAIELISLKTRFNFFGVKYQYNLDNKNFSSGINFLGVYPIEVSITWVIFKYLSFCIAFLIVNAFSSGYLLIVFLTPLILVSIDLVVDPLAVNKYKMWKWQRGSKYFGIPYTNFLGWFFVGLVSSLSLLFIEFQKSLDFHYILLLPVIFYALIFKNLSKIYELDKLKTILGAIPALTWVILGFISIMILS